MPSFQHVPALAYSYSSVTVLHIEVVVEIMRVRIDDGIFGIYTAGSPEYLLFSFHRLPLGVGFCFIINNFLIMIEIIFMFRNLLINTCNSDISFCLRDGVEDEEEESFEIRFVSFSNKFKYSKNKFISKFCFFFNLRLK